MSGSHLVSTSCSQVTFPTERLYEPRPAVFLENRSRWNESEPQLDSLCPTHPDDKTCPHPRERDTRANPSNPKKNESQKKKVNFDSNLTYISLNWYIFGHLNIKRLLLYIIHSTYVRKWLKPSNRFFCRFLKILMEMVEYDYWIRIDKYCI